MRLSGDERFMRSISRLCKQFIDTHMHAGSHGVYKDLATHAVMGKHVTEEKGLTRLTCNFRPPRLCEAPPFQQLPLTAAEEGSRRSQPNVDAEHRHDAMKSRTTTSAIVA